MPGGRDVGQNIVDTFYGSKGCSAYADFRELFDKEKDLNAVKIMTPDHLHGVIAMAAMKRGKHVIVHKPIANRLMEADQVIETARSTGVATHFMPWDSNGSMEQVMAWIRDGSIGTLREIHNWTNRPVWPQYATIPTDTPPVPEGFDWDLWLGPERERPYHPNYTHMVFRGWYDFGGGSMADMGHYSLWTVFRALDLAGPTSIEPMLSHDQLLTDGIASGIKNDFSFPSASVVRFQYPARGERGAVDLIWYEGGMRPPTPPELDEDRKEFAAEAHDVRRRQGQNSRRIPRGESAPDSGAPHERLPCPGGRDANAARTRTIIGGPAPVGGGLQGRRAIARQFPACRRNFRGGEPVRGCIAHAPPPVLRRGESQDHQRAGSQQISFARVSQGLESRIHMNFNRRQFLGAAPAALAAARVLRADPLGMPIGCQTWPVRAGSGQGFRGHAAQPRRSSAIKTIEMCSPASYADFRPLAGMTAAQMRHTIEAAGLRCMSCHYNFKELKENLDERMAFAKELGLKQMVLSSFGLPANASLGRLQAGGHGSQPRRRAHAEGRNPTGLSQSQQRVQGDRRRADLRRADAARSTPNWSRCNSRWR